MMLDPLITALRLLAATAICLASSVPAAASHLVTGNGHGFAVVAPERGAATSFYPHPHSFTRPDPANPLSEGIETANFIKSLSWGEPGRAASADYVDDSHVIRLRRADGGGTIFMPFGFERPALIIAKTSSTAWRVEWNRPLRSRKIVGAGVELLRFEGIDEPLLLIPLGVAGKAPPDQPLAASAAWALTALESDEDADAAIRDFGRWRAGLPPAALVKRELARFERWRTKPAVQFRNEKERRLWRQSEAMLRMAQSREPNRPGRYGNGLIVAALPDVYSTPWVRDMAWATVALTRMGHRREARAALLAYFNARPTGKMRGQVNGADYQISVVRYFGDGAEEPFFTQEGSANIEFDNWGEALWVLGEYVRKYDDPALLKAVTYRGSLYDSARYFIVRPLLPDRRVGGNDPPILVTLGIGEERQKDKKHFAFSTALAIVGLKEFADVAQRAGDAHARKQALEQVGLLEKGFTAAFIRGGKLRGTLEEGVKNDIDGALIPVINFGLVRDPAVIRDAVERMALLRVASGGYRRVRSTYTDPKIFEYWYERQEFLFVDFALAELLRQRGQAAAADAMLARITGKAAADHNIIPEMYVALPCALFPGKVGDPTGAIPMVGYGAGVYILHILERSAAK
jgi:hypothetical protein